ncbi:hypothetical protein [Streptomyces sp. NPDC007083]|uniref:hypothetical protein n=1 Tax=unclassified Streptomyces TaxID=2593676 RepID=UPI0033CC7D65
MLDRAIFSRLIVRATFATCLRAEENAVVDHFFHESSEEGGASPSIRVMIPFSANCSSVGAFSTSQMTES